MHESVSTRTSADGFRQAADAPAMVAQHGTLVDHDAASVSDLFEDLRRRSENEHLIKQ